MHFAVGLRAPKVLPHRCAQLPDALLPIGGSLIAALTVSPVPVERAN